MFFNDAREFLKRSGTHDGAQVRTRKHKNEKANLPWPNEVTLNKKYAKEFNDPSEGGILDKNFLRGGGPVKVGLGEYGNVVINYISGTKIDYVDWSQSMINNGASIKGSPLHFKYQGRTVGFILFSSIENRTGFLNDYYYYYYYYYYPYFNSQKNRTPLNNFNFKK